MFYATLDSEDFHINETAYIAKFDTRAEAEDYLRGAYDPSEWTVQIETGHFGDCWLKTSNAPKVGGNFLSPFSYTQLSVRAPGQHPGGKQYWIEPRVDVLIARAIPIEI